jgi:hypothetical protein
VKIAGNQTRSYSCGRNILGCSWLAYYSSAVVAVQTGDDAPLRCEMKHLFRCRMQHTIICVLDCLIRLISSLPIVGPLVYSSIDHRSLDISSAWAVLHSVAADSGYNSIRKIVEADSGRLRLLPELIMHAFEHVCFTTRCCGRK